MWVQKHRPQSFADVKGHTGVIESLERLVQSGALPHVLLYGPPGTGKTSIARALVRRIPTARVLHLDTTCCGTIEQVRTLLLEFLTVGNFKHKMVVVDEADQLSPKTQAVIASIVDAHRVQLVMTCNLIEGIVAPLLARVLSLRIGPLEPAVLSQRLHEIALAEGVELTPLASHALIRQSRGDLRKAINAMQSLCYHDHTVTEQLVYELTSDVSPTQVHHWLETDAEPSFELVASACEIIRLWLLSAANRSLNAANRSQRRVDLAPLLCALSDVEQNICNGANAKLQFRYFKLLVNNPELYEPPFPYH